MENQDYLFDVPVHLGKRIFRKVDLFEGWYPGLELRTTELAAPTALWTQGLRARLFQMSFYDFQMMHVENRLKGFGHGTVEQMISFAIKYPDIADKIELVAPGTVSTDLTDFRWCFPSLRTVRKDDKRTRYLNFELTMSKEVYLLGIHPA